jgi:predicted transcriptional regulator
MPPSPRPGDLQLAILDVLWERGEATVADVHQDLLSARGLAPTTIATMLRKMDERGLCAHRREGRSLVYRARVARDQVHRSMVGDLIDRLFAGDPKQLVHHLLSEGEIDLAELEDLRRRVGRARRAGGRDGR